MKLSQAMRKGARMGPQVFGDYFGPGDASCAMGAVMLGMGVPGKEASDTILKGRWAAASIWPELHLPAVSPADGMIDSLFAIIVILNDRFHWTRERIAGWIESHVETPTYSLLDMQHYMEGPEDPVPALKPIPEEAYAI